MSSSAFGLALALSLQFQAPTPVQKSLRLSVVARRERSLEDMIAMASEMLVMRDLAQYGDPIVFVAGVPRQDGEDDERGEAAPDRRGSEAALNAARLRAVSQELVPLPTRSRGLLLAEVVRRGSAHGIHVTTTAFVRLKAIAVQKLAASRYSTW